MKEWRERWFARRRQRFARAALGSESAWIIVPKADGFALEGRNRHPETPRDPNPETRDPDAEIGDPDAPKHGPEAGRNWLTNVKPCEKVVERVKRPPRMGEHLRKARYTQLSILRGRGRRRAENGDEYGGLAYRK